MQHPVLKTIGKRVLQIGLPIVIVASLLYKVRDWGDWHELIASVHQWNYSLLALSFLASYSRKCRMG